MGRQAVTEREVVAHLEKHPFTDAFLEQTVLAWQHGRRLTALGRLILKDRLSAANHRTEKGVLA